MSETKWDAPDPLGQSRAFLIAAAPELYEALEALRGWVQADIDQFDGSTPDDFIWDAVHAALKKARGEQ